MNRVCSYGSYLKNDTIKQEWSKVSREDWLNILTLFILKMNDWWWWSRNIIENKKVMEKVNGCDCTLFDTISFDVWQHSYNLESGLKNKKDDLTELRGSLWKSLLHHFVWVKGFYWYKRWNEEIQRRKICQRWMQRLYSGLEAGEYFEEVVAYACCVCGRGALLRYLLGSTVRGRIWEQKAIWADLVHAQWCSFRTHVYKKH